MTIHKNTQLDNSTIKFKINYFKPATGEFLICRSKVINNGRKIKVSESEVFAVAKGQEKLVSKAMITLIAVPADSVTKPPTRTKSR